MSSHQEPSRRSPARWLVRATIAAGALLWLAGPAQPQNLNLNIFQQLVRPNQPAQQPNPGGMLGNALTGSATSGNAATAGATLDLIAVLMQPEEQIDEAKEVEIGRQLGSVLLGAKPLHPDMALQRYVNQLGRWISLQTSRPNLPWTFAVLDDPGFNAFAAPGGFVFLTKGLIDRLSDESELAGILAHEMTHVVQKHHLRALRKKAVGGAASQLGGQLLASQLNKNLGAVGSVVTSQIASLARDTYTKGLDQEDEFESDRLGVTLAASAGFDPYGLVAVLHQLRTVTPDNPVFTLSISTHPAAQARMDLVEQAMGNRLDALTGKPAVKLAQRLQQVAATQPPAGTFVAAAGGAAAAAAPMPGGNPNPQVLAAAQPSASAIKAGDVLLPKVAGVKAYRDANEGRELATLARTDEVVFEGAEKDGFMRVVTPKGTGWVKAIMLRKP